MKYRRVASLKTADKFQGYLAGLGIDLPFDEALEAGPSAPLAQTQPLKSGATVGNRLATLPMEGWDGTKDGSPTELTTRRWQNFGKSGAKLIWGGEAVAVRHDGRANPNQLLITTETWGDLAGLREALVEAHEADFGDRSDLVVAAINPRRSLFPSKRESPSGANDSVPPSDPRPEIRHSRGLAGSDRRRNQAVGR
jgi:hypothetical protein